MTRVTGDLVTGSIKHAQELVELCTATADETTQLEASAYLTFIEGTRMLEKGDDFATALAKFNASRALCEHRSDSHKMHSSSRRTNDAWRT
ncbi:signal recognition particle subunit SRP68 [Pseudoscourfieldia marina]